MVPWSTVYTPLRLHLFLSSLHTISTALALSGSAIHSSLYLSFMMWRMRGLLGSCFLPFISSWAGYCPSEGLCPHSLLGLPLVSLFHGHGPFGHSSCHTASLCWLQLYLSFNSYPVGLLADAITISAHWSVNSLLRASLAHLPHLYLSSIL